MVDPPQRVKGQNKRPGADEEIGGSDKPAASSSPSNGANGASSTARSGGGGESGGGSGSGLLGLIRNILIVLVVVGVIVLIVFLLRDDDDDGDPGPRFPTLSPNAPPSAAVGSNMLLEIRQRQKLRCGVPNEYVGFGATNATSGQYEGFDVDLVCMENSDISRKMQRKNCIRKNECLGQCFICLISTTTFFVLF